MMDARLLKRLLAVSAVLTAVAAASSIALGFPAVALGLGIGWVLGAVPPASWAWISSRGFASKRNRILAAVLVLGKLFFYSGVLYVAVTRPLAHPVAVFAGLTGVVAVLTLGTLLQGGASKEAA